jgi:hypothetical protein
VKPSSAATSCRTVVLPLPSCQTARGPRGPARGRAGCRPRRRDSIEGQEVDLGRVVRPEGERRALADLLLLLARTECAAGLPLIRLISDLYGSEPPTLSEKLIMRNDHVGSQRSAILSNRPARGVRRRPAAGSCSVSGAQASAPQCAPARRLGRLLRWMSRRCPAPRSMPISLLHRRKGSSAACAIEFHSTRHLDVARGSRAARCCFRLTHGHAASRRDGADPHRRAPSKAALAVSWGWYPYRSHPAACRRDARLPTAVAVPA